NAINGTASKNFAKTSYKAAVKSGTAQVFSYKTYNINRLSENLRDHKLMIGFAPYQNPIISVAVILENGGTGMAIGDLVRNIFDYVLLDKTI
ncbi:MAG: penicillin-binding transpeptidase domain-containing protein, partial [Arsenophonus sp. ER-EMS1-MAG3]